MKRLVWALAWILAAPVAALGQATGASLSLDVGTAPLPRLGLWTGVAERLSLGFEVGVDTRSWTTFANGDPARSMSGRDWGLAVGPAARFRIARTGQVSLSWYGSLTYGNHWLAPRSLVDPVAAPDEHGFGARTGLALDWDLDRHWSLGALYSGSWTSEDARVLGVERARWSAPRLGLSVRLRF